MNYTDDDYDGFASLDDSEREAIVRRVLQGAYNSFFDQQGDSFKDGAHALWDSYDRGRKLSDGVKDRYLREVANKGEPFTEDDIRGIAGYAGRDESGFSPFNGDDEGVTDEMLEGYAKYLRNYLYTYKDEAQDVDPSIDPEEEHAGPMAQDIEKVAPDCVKETPEGVKTVDGNRLALVNAGVIGELSRRVLELEEKLNVSTLG